MFGILRNLREGAAASRLRERGKNDVRPDSAVDLARHFVSKGRFREAMEVVSEGLARFPYSQRLRELQRFVWRELNGNEMTRLRRATERDGRREDFLELIDLHLDCEDFDEALLAAERWQERDSEDLEARLVQAQILLERFRRDRVAADARRAVAILKRVLDADPERFEAHFALARVYEFIGATSKGLFHVYRALDARPDDEEVNALYVALSARELEQGDENVLLNAIEEEADRGGSGDVAELSVEERRQIMNGLVRLAQLNGVRRTAFVDDRTAITAEGLEGRVHADPDENDLCRMARGFRGAAGASSRRMGIGAFRSCVLDCGDKSLQVHGVGRTIVLVELDGAHDEETVFAECASFLAACLRRVEEPSRA
ncbi:MAG: hypothetical protein R3F20_19670 [Planctomycetota bacterium]